MTLAPLGARTGTRAVRLTDAEGTAYWLEYRTATGADAWLGRAATNPYRLETGVLLRREAEFPDTSLLLDGTPSASSGWADDLQAALPVGVPVTLSGGDFTVTLRSATAGRATIDVQPAGPTAAAPAPAAPRENGAGRVLAGGGGSSAAGTGSGAASADDAPAAAAAEAAGAAPWVPAPPTPVAAGTPALEPASGSAPTGTRSWRWPARAWPARRCWSCAGCAGCASADPGGRRPDPPGGPGLLVRARTTRRRRRSCR